MLIERLVSDPANQYGREHGELLGKGWRSPGSGLWPLSQPSRGGPITACGMTFEDNQGVYLLEAMVVSQSPRPFTRIRCPRGRAPGEYRLYAKGPVLARAVTVPEISLLLGRPISFDVDLHVAEAAPQSNIDDFQWRTGCKMDAALERLVRTHAVVMTEDGEDVIWTVTPCAADNSIRTFFILSSMRNSLDMLTVDALFGDRGYCVDHLGDTEYCDGDFVEAYNRLQKISDVYESRE